MRVEVATHAGVIHAIEDPQHFLFVVREEGEFVRYPITFRLTGGVLTVAPDFGCALTIKLDRADEGVRLILIRGFDSDRGSEELGVEDSGGGPGGAGGGGDA